MTYSVKEIFYTLQGEGAQTGRPSVFCRFTGCNLWSGIEQQREQSVCRFCDTDFVGTDGKGGGKFQNAKALANAINSQWPDQQSHSAKKYVVCTGGEPLLQLDAKLIDELHNLDFEIAVETNGTIKAPEGIDWICVSPKGTAPLEQTSGDELKLVYPQTEQEAHPEKFMSLDFTHRYLQPMDSPNIEQNTKDTIAYCLENPEWKMSIQTHKIVGID